ncbi:MAG: HNH endonuclease [Bacteroidales bacterium]|nr:HNH endonuclease [Bacteroidales bacterium]
MDRKSITKKVRFEIFKRDNFTCCYCGRKPPDVMLEVDHIIPVAQNGNNDINNLLTSCFNCNRGKGKNELNQMPNALQENIDILKEKQKQYLQYKKYIEKLHKESESDIEEIGLYFFKLFKKENTIFAGNWKGSIKMFLQTFNKYEIIDAIDIAYSRISRKYTIKENDVFVYMCGVLHTWKREKKCQK